MRDLLAGADVAQDLPVNVWPSGELRYHGFNLGRPEFVEQLVAGVGGGGLTGMAHTRAFYDRLPFGWCPAPQGTPSDMHMYRQLATMPGFRGAMSDRLTTLNFPSSVRGDMSVAERVAELARWESRLGDPDLAAELDRLTALAARAAAERLKLVAVGLEQELDQVLGTRWWRLRVAAAESALGRAFAAIGLTRWRSETCVPTNCRSSRTCCTRPSTGGPTRASEARSCSGSTNSPATVHVRISLSFDPDNPAKRLYARLA